MFGLQCKPHYCITLICPHFKLQNHQSCCKIQKNSHLHLIMRVDLHFDMDPFIDDNNCVNLCFIPHLETLISPSIPGCIRVLAVVVTATAAALHHGT